MTEIVRLVDGPFDGRSLAFGTAPARWVVVPELPPVWTLYVESPDDLRGYRHFYERDPDFPTVYRWQYCEVA